MSGIYREALSLSVVKLFEFVAKCFKKAGYSPMGNNWLQNDAKTQQITCQRGFTLAFQVDPLRLLKIGKEILAADVGSPRIFDPLEAPNNPLDKYFHF